MKVAIAILALAAFPSTTAEGKSADDKAMVLNIEGAPIGLSAEVRTLSVENQTAQPISLYQLGCARAKGTKLKIVHRFPEETIEIPIQGSVSSASFHLPPHKILICSQLNSKLIPIKAATKDGQVWKLRPSAKVVE